MAGSALLFLLFQQGAIVHADGEEVFQLTRAIVRHGTIAIDPHPDFQLVGDDNIGSPGVDGHFYSRYGVGLSILAIPLYLVAIALDALLGHSDLIEGFAAASVMPLICAALVGAMYSLCRRLGAGERMSAVVGFGSVVGTFVLPYTKEFFGEPLMALLTVLMLERILARKGTQAATALALAALVRPQALAFAPFLGLAVLYREGFWAAVRACVPMALAAAFTLGYDHWRFGKFLSTGYETDEGFNTPLQVGVRGLLFNAQKSLFLFCPLVLAVPFGVRALWRRDWFAPTLIGANFVVTFLLTAKWSGWDGDWAWGPRLLIPALIPLLALAAPWMERRLRNARLGLALLAIGFLVSLPCFLVPMQTQQEQHVLSPDIVRQYKLIGSTSSYSASHLVHAHSGTENHRSYLSVWQVLMAREFGIAGFLLALLATAAIAAPLVPIGRRLRTALALPSETEEPRGSPVAV